VRLLRFAGWPLLRRQSRDLHAMSGAYALDALDERERARFERHLAECPACQREVSELQDIAARFGLAVSAQPPSSLKPRVLAGVGGAGRPGPVASVIPLQSAARPRSDRSRSGQAWPRRIAVPVAAAACLAVAIAFGVLFAVARGQYDSAHSEEDEIADVLSAPGTRAISDKTSIGGQVTVDVSSALHEMVVTTDGLPGLPASEAYQLWLLAPGDAASSDGLLTAIGQDRTAPVVNSGLRPGDRVGLTVEPAGGTAKPTTTPIALISLPP
jgi:anti-sigma-K factor RskA